MSSICCVGQFEYFPSVPEARVDRRLCGSSSVHLLIMTSDEFPQVSTLLFHGQ